MYSDYVLANEIRLKAKQKLNQNIFIKKDSQSHIYFSGVVLLRKDCIKDEYRHLVSTCVDMSMYKPITYLSTLLGRNKSFLGSKKIKCKLEILKVGKITLVKLPVKFVDLLNKNKVPYLKKEKEEYEKNMEIVDFYGMEVGFY